MNVKEIKFGFADYGVDKLHTYSLGLGPCGRWVSSLVVEISLASLTIKQESFTEDRDGAQRVAWAEYMTLQAGLLKARGSHQLDGVGWDNVQYMTPTLGAWKERNTRNAAERERIGALRGETKVFVYKLEDIRGRITALQ